MIARLAPFVSLLLGCARRAPPPPDPPQHGWLAEIATTIAQRASLPCERAATLDPAEAARDADDGIARTLELDLDGDGRAERVVYAIRRETVIAVTDAACQPLLRAGVGEGAAMQGPTLPSNPWDAVPPDEIDRLARTDRLPAGNTVQLHVVEGAGGHRHAVFLTVGSLGHLRYGWRASVVSCHQGRCRHDALGHSEWAALPREVGCGPTARTNRSPPYIEDPLLRVDLGPAPGALTLTPHARVRDTCDARVDERVRPLQPVRIAP
ncbi:MAG: hypothetical protein U0325_17300 [Polyangiales bacterium]